MAVIPRDINRPLILLSNREPYEHVRADGHLDAAPPAGGLVSALDPMMRRVGGTWVAWGSGPADRDVVDEHSRVAVPPCDPSYTLRRVWLNEAEVEGYYLGFANSALWPLCHMFIQYLDVRAAHWDSYRAVNRRFADAVCEEIDRVGAEAEVWIQDYHFALAAQLVRERAPDTLIHHFWHIPFPPADVLRLMPIAVHDAILSGMLGSDLIEFQTDQHARNFLDCVERMLPPGRVDHNSGTIDYDGRQIAVRTFPISIDMDEWERRALLPRTREVASSLRSRYASDTRKLIVSVDRIDYTKGLVRRLTALEQVWTDQPDRRGTFTALIVATPSRSDIRAYSALETELVTTVTRINDAFRTEAWTPIVLVRENVSADLLAAVYVAADVCVVSSLQDGMNLVAKEFIACQR